MLISWNITKACNLKCEHCYRDAGFAAPDELNLLEGKKLLRELKDLNFRLIIFSGGEPVLRVELFQWIPFARGLGLISVLGTNGTLIDEKCAVRLKQAGLKRLGISIDSIDEKKHDKFRRLEGAWKQAVRGMENAKKAGLEFQVHTTVTKKILTRSWLLQILRKKQMRRRIIYSFLYLLAEARRSMMLSPVRKSMRD